MASGKTAVIASGKPFRPSTTAISMIIDAAISELVHHAQPEFGASCCSSQRPRMSLVPSGVNAERDIDGLVAHEPLVADFDPQGVEENQGIDRLERPSLPCGDVSRTASVTTQIEIGRDIDAIELEQMADDLANAHAARVHRDRSSRRSRESGADSARSAVGSKVACRSRGTPETSLRGLGDAPSSCHSRCGCCASAASPSRW